MCDACKGTVHPDDSLAGIRNGDILCNTIASRYQSIDDFGRSDLSAMSPEMMAALAATNASLAQARELRQIRLLLEMMFMGGASIVPQASDTSKGGDDTDTRP